jgi:hypothetical protein
MHAKGINGVRADMAFRPVFYDCQAVMLDLNADER